MKKSMIIIFFLNSIFAVGQFNNERFSISTNSFISQKDEPINKPEAPFINNTAAITCNSNSFYSINTNGDINEFTLIGNLA